MFGKEDDILKEARSYPYWKQHFISIVCAVLHNFMYMTSHDSNCLHMYLHHEEDDDDENEDDENGDKDGDAEMEEDTGPPEPVSYDLRVMTAVRS